MKKNYVNGSLRLLGAEQPASSSGATAINASAPLVKPKKRALRYFTLLTVSLLLGLSVASRAQMFFPGNQYEIVSVNSGKALEVAGGSLAPGAGVQQWDFNQWGHQLWRAIEDPANPNYIIFINRNSGLVLEVANSGLGDGDLIQQGVDIGSPAQRWKVVLVPGTSWKTARYNIYNVNSGKVLEIGGARTNNGASANQWFLLAPNQYFTQEHQQWTFTSHEIGNGANPAIEYGGAYALYNAYSNKLLSLGPGLLLNSGTPVGAHSTVDGANTEWIIYVEQIGATAPATTHNIINRESYRALSPVNGFTTPGTGLEQGATGASSPSKWTITTIGPNNLVRISPASNSNLYLGVPSTANTINGQQATIDTWSAIPQTQEWQLLSTGLYRGTATAPVANPTAKPVYTLSPNPAVDEVVIQPTALASEKSKSTGATKGITTLLVYDVYGKLRLEQRNVEPGPIHLRVDKLPDGIYSVHLLNGKEVINRQRLQIKH